jgi:glycosyltransferase involved in cell wall biosynthesis
MSAESRGIVRRDGTGERARVLYVQYTDPAAYPPLEHGAWLLAQAGCDVRFVGLDLTNRLMQMAPHPSVTVDLQEGAPPGWRQKVQFLRFVWSAAREARRWRATWIYASDTLAAPAALVASWLTGARTIYHEHDAPGGSQSVFMRLARMARRQLLSRASVVVVPSDERARFLDAEAHRAAVVRNMPLRREVRGPRTVPSDARHLRVFYHGSIVPARLPLGVIDALSELPSGVTLTIAGYDPAGGIHLDALVDRARLKNVGDRVHVAGVVPTREALLDLASSCDVGLAFMPSRTTDPNEQTMVGASNKPFDYLACGLALLVTDVPAWRETYVTPGYGRACVPESSSSIASQLRWLLEHPEDRWRMGESGRERVQHDWHYEHEFLPVIGRVMNVSDAQMAAAAAVCA